MSNISTEERFQEKLKSILAEMSRAKDPVAFFETLREVTSFLRTEASSSSEHTRWISNLHSSSTLSPDAKVALSLACAPIFGKPLLPAKDLGLDKSSFMWSFLIPVTVQLSDEVELTPVELSQSHFNLEDFVSILDDCDFLTKEASVRGFFVPFQREDFLNWGPENLALTLVRSEIQDTASPKPLPVAFSDDTPAYSSVTFYFLMAAVLPAKTDTTLIKSSPDAGFGEKIALYVENGLKSAGLQPTQITVCTPCHLSKAFMLCAEPNMSALVKNIETAKRLLEVKSVRVRQPMPGLVEVVGYDEQNKAHLIAPAQLMVESMDLFMDSLSGPLKALGLDCKGKAKPSLSLVSRTLQ